MWVSPHYLQEGTHINFCGATQSLTVPSPAQRSAADVLSPENTERSVTVTASEVRTFRIEFGTICLTIDRNDFRVGNQIRCNCKKPSYHLELLFDYKGFMWLGYYVLKDFSFRFYAFQGHEILLHLPT